MNGENERKAYEHPNLKYYEDLIKAYSSKKISALPIESQRKIKEGALSDIQTIKNSYEENGAEFSKLTIKLSDIENDIISIQDLQSKGYDMTLALHIANEKKDQLRKDITALQEKLREEKEILNLLENYLKDMKYSEIKKRVSDFKMIVKSTPQRICSVNISLLNKIKDKGREKYSHIYDKFEENINVADKQMQNLEKEVEILNQNSNATAFERYSMSMDIRKKQKREYKKIKKYARRANVLAKLKIGIVRSIDVSLELYNKLNDNYEQKQFKAS